MSTNRVGAGMRKGENASGRNGEGLFPQPADGPDRAEPPAGPATPVALSTGVEIAPEEIRPGAGALLVIPEETLDPSADDGGEPLEADPALMTVKLERPAPHSWVQLFPERSMRTVLLAHQPVQGRSADYYFIAQELRGPVQHHLKQVIVYLVYDDTNRHSFLWLMPDTEHSPYRSAVLRVLAKGQEFATKHLFRFGKATLGKPLDVKFKELGPGSPGPTLPSRPLTQLLPEALGQDRLILNTAHPVYIDLVAGRAVS